MAQLYTSFTPEAVNAPIACTNDPPVSISSSKVNAVLPLTSPMTFNNSTLPLLSDLLFSIIANGDESLAAKSLAFLLIPTSVATTTKSFFNFLK